MDEKNTNDTNKRSLINPVFILIYSFKSKQYQLFKQHVNYTSLTI